MASRAALKPYQVTGLQKMNGKLRFAIFWEMGTGKTRLIIENNEQIYRKNPRRPFVVFVVCPVSAIHTWTEELAKWATVPTVCVNLSEEPGSIKNLAPLISEEPVYYLCSYEMLRSRYDSHVFRTIIKLIRVIVADESVKIKNPKAKITQLVATGRGKTRRPIFSHVPHRYILSGLPITRHHLDIFCQMRFLSAGILGENFYGFRQQYFQKDFMGFNWDLKNGSEQRIAQKIGPHMSRIRKADVLSELEPKVYQVRTCELGAQASRLYKELNEEWTLGFNSGEVIDIKWAFTLAQKLQQICCGLIKPAKQGGVLAAPQPQRNVRLMEPSFASQLPVPYSTGTLSHSIAEAGWLFIDEKPAKIKLLLEILNELPEDEKVVIWCFYRGDLVQIEQALFGHYSAVFYHGGLSKEKRSEAVAAFQNRPDVRCFVSQVTAGATALNLQVARYAVYYSNTHNYGDRRQSEDRIHRVGQLGQCVYIDLMTKKTVEETYLKAFEHKMGLMEYLNNEVSTSRL